MELLRQPEEFNCTRDRTITERWSNYVTKMERYFVMIKMTEADSKQAALLYYGGQDLCNVFETLKSKMVVRHPETHVRFDIYQQTKTVLEKHFSSGESVTYERSNFRATKQLVNESAKDYVTRLRRKAMFCKFENYGLDAAIIDQYIEHCTSDSLRVKLLSMDNLTLDELLSTAQARELAAHHAADIVKNSDSQNANVKDEDSNEAWAITSRSNSRARSNNNMYCYGCGGKDHIHGSFKCPANEKICYKCGRVGHFISVCRSPSKSGQNEGRQQVRRYQNQGNVNQVWNRDSRDVEEDRSTDISETLHAFAFYIDAINPKQHKTRIVKVDGNSVSFVIDSGATVCMIDYNTYKSTFEGKVCLEPTNARIYTYGSKIPMSLSGVFYPSFEYGENRTIAAVIVTATEDAGCLLSETVSSQLGILKMDSQINSVTSDERIGNITDEFGEVFKGIGKLKGYQMELEIDETVKPCVQPCRTIPYHKLKLVDKEISRLLSQDIIERVTTATSWCSPLHAEHKKNGDIRICVDMRKANAAVKRVYYPIPTLEDVQDKVSGSMWFSKLDLKKGYHQIELNENSRDITTFRYTNGIYRYKRLLFGLNAAFELFQQTISALFRGHEGIINISDDILVYGKTVSDHNRNLRKCLEILQENGLTLNKEKCEFLKKDLEYYGFVISEKGIRPKDSTVKAIHCFQTPRNSKEVRSFLGLINYLGRFMPHLATQTAPLRVLTTKNYTWRWTKVEEDCFRKLKNAVSSSTVMQHFKTGLPTKLVVDASPVGLGAILMQDHGNGEYKPVCYASRSLSSVEQRYSQTEREALGVIWACEKFHLYVYGKQITIQTDHKPLIGLLGAGGNRSARINRWVLRLLQYDFQLEYLPGQDNPADVLSRCPMSHGKGNNRNWTSGYELETEQHVNQVIAHSIPKTLNLSQIREVCSKDEETQRLIDAVVNNKWARYPELKAYKRICAELMHKGGIILKGDLIVIPSSLRKRVLEIAHANHMGINKTKGLLRSKVWWPTMAHDIEDMVKSCSSCTMVQPVSKPEPLTMTDMPAVWSKLNLDLCGPMPDGWSIIGIVDAGTRWPEVFFVKSTTTSVITRKLTELFVNKVRPIEIVTDNGPHFSSLEFEQFCKRWGIKHHPVTPYYPQANSEIERFFRTVMKTIKLAVLEGKNWKDELQNFLLVYRNTPHCTTGKSPAELMYGRQLRDTLPSKEPKPTKVYKEAMDVDAKNKRRIKAHADQGLKHSTIKVGDTVVIKQRRKNKFSTTFGTKKYTVVARNKATLRLQDSGGKVIKRHTSAARVLQNRRNIQSSCEQIATELLEDIDTPDMTGQIPRVEPGTPRFPLLERVELDDAEEGVHMQPSLPQQHVPPAQGLVPQSGFVRRSERSNAGSGVARYGY